MTATSDSCRMFRRPLGRASSMVLLLMLPGCSDLGVLAPAGEVAERQWAHLSEIFLWMLVVIVPLFVALPVILWRYRLDGPGRHRPRWAFSWPLEFLLWGVPLVVVSVLAWNLWNETLELDPYKTIGAGDVLKIDVIAYDWKWLFVYPVENLALVDLLVLPTGRPVELRLTSATALQAFSVPRLGGQIYAMPGMTTRFNLRTDAAGQFEGLNTQYNGRHFARQRFEVNVLNPGGFAAWANATRKAPPLDQAAMRRLEKPGVLDAPLAFGSVPHDPFAQAVGSHGSQHLADSVREAGDG